jgi:hypothetical protein
MRSLGSVDRVDLSESVASLMADASARSPPSVLRVTGEANRIPLRYDREGDSLLAPVWADWLSIRFNRTIYLGVIPTLKRLVNYFNPPKRMPIVQAESSKKLPIPWAEIGAVLSGVGAVLGPWPTRRSDVCIASSRPEVFAVVVPRITSGEQAIKHTPRHGRTF